MFRCNSEVLYDPPRRRARCSYEDEIFHREITFTQVGTVSGAHVPNPHGGGGAGAPLLLKDQKAKAAAESGPIEGEGDFPGTLGAIYYMLRSSCAFLIYTIFSNKNFEIKFKNDRQGLSLSAVFLLLFMVVHSVGNLHIFLGPDDMNSYGYFYDRQYFSAVTNGAIPIDANALEIYLYLSILLHISVALKRTWDINRTMTFDSGES